MSFGISLVLHDFTKIKGGGLIVESANPFVAGILKGCSEQIPPPHHYPVIEIILAT